MQFSCVEFGVSVCVMREQSDGILFHCALHLPERNNQPWSEITIICIKIGDNHT